MKRFFVFALTLALVAIFALGAGAADRKGMVGVGVGGGLLLPMGDFGDLAKMGWRASGGVGYFFSNEIMLGVTGAYSQNKPKDNVVFTDSTGDTLDVKFKIMQYGVFGQYMFKMQNDKIAPYLKAGLGFYNQKLSATGFESASETDLGINGGVGVGLAVSPMASVFLEGGFHNIFSEGSSTNFITATVGLALMFGGSGGGTQ